MKKMYHISYIEYRRKDGAGSRFRPKPKGTPTKSDLLRHYRRITPIGKTRKMIVSVRDKDSVEEVFQQHCPRRLFESRIARVIVGIDPLDCSGEVNKMKAQEVVR
ncbi:hypothetical protein SAMN02745220_03248 [Desulfopila aestuarii DSM 18488]|uniref:Uncharacterized protein n=1 Tax=Desulfopila aestuarii DSM 18488 TaxID=1121416 RepID=A0A1M7YBS5_9BACT|nr:hypothetical protein SAMN02745220_03248 [Desulfopila aestuarii DSM 18488]